MKLFVAILVASSLTVASGSWHESPKHEESKWDIIHHEYHGPPAPLAKDGRVVDTPEVSEARANHLSIHAETIADLEKMKSKVESEGQSEASPMLPAEIMAMMLGQEKHVEAEVEEKKWDEEKWEEEMPKEEEVKPIVEHEVNNEVDFGHPMVIYQASYEGPKAPLGKDGRVEDTPEVKKAKEAHFSAYKEVEKKLTKKEEDWKPIMESSADSGEEMAKEEAKGEFKLESHGWYEKPEQKVVYVPPMHMHYHQEAPMGYKGPAAPLGEDGRVVDTAEVERAKAAHWKAYQHAKEIAKRHPPKAEDNRI